MKLKRLSRRYLRFVPRVETADSNVGVREKVMYTFTSLLIYLVCTHLPLYGIPSLKHGDPFYPFNSFFPVIASVRGTVMDLALLSIVISRTFTLLLVWVSFVAIDINAREDRDDLHDLQKLLHMLWSSAFSAMYVTALISRLYGTGTTDQLGVGTVILLIFQLWFPGIIVIYLDELLQRGYGFGPGISLFCATSVCEDIIWKSFYQQNLDYVTNLLATILIFLIVIYLQGFHVLLPLRSTNESGQQGSYQIKFFYATNTPFFVLSAAVTCFCKFSWILHSHLSGNFFVDLLGKWTKSEYAGGRPILVGGVAYLITAPSSLADMAVNPFRALFYLMFMTSTCVFLSDVWIEISDSSVAHVAIQLMGQGMVVTESLGLNHIPTATALGSMCIVALTVLADLSGAFGSASGILFAVTVISQHLETFEKEKEIELVSLDPLGC